MSRAKKVMLVIITLIVLAFASMAFWLGRPVTSAEASEKFIYANPFTLSQIAGFSKYRSCMGHDFRPPMLNGEKESSPRSMKHYVRAREEFRGTDNVVEARAPFDGEVSVIEQDFEGSPTDRQIWLTPDSRSARQWHLVFFHVNIKDDIKEGTQVKAGQIIGWANLKRGPDGATDNFDIAVKLTRPLHRPAGDAPFAHFSEDVLAEFALYGASPGDLVIAEAERDANPCPLDLSRQGPDVYFPPGAGADEQVWLSQRE